MYRFNLLVKKSGKTLKKKKTQCPSTVANRHILFPDTVHTEKLHHLRDVPNGILTCLTTRMPGKAVLLQYSPNPAAMSSLSN